MSKQFKLTQELRFYQAAAVESIRSYTQSDLTSRSILYSAPTGSGKSLIFLHSLAGDPYGFGITPRIEIIAGMLEKAGEDVANLSTVKLVDLALEYRITTPVRFRNMLAKGTLPFRPWRLYIDEAHHSEADTYKDIKAYLPEAMRIGLTATPFRGTPRSTADFKKDWDEHIEVMNVNQAAELGVIEIPDCEIWPLVDDDEIEITNGEFSATSAAELNISRADDLVQRVIQSGFYREGSWDKPTMFSVSTRDQAYDLQNRLELVSIRANAIVQDTSRSERETVFRQCIQRETAIIQIGVVSEGVDLAIRRIIDMRPTFSPVFWLQMVGRCTRPGGKSTYICCNRNLERHGYLYCGMIPPSKIAEAQTAFTGKMPSTRANSRAVGLEALGRLRATPIKFEDGCMGAVYNLVSMDQFVKLEISILLHPAKMEPITAVKRNERNPSTGELTYGKWTRVATIPDVTGYASASGGTISPKQSDSWNKWAKRFGLDASVVPNRKNIQAYYMLRDLNCFEFKGRR